ncbi:uncharacterized protein LOC144605837 [Rhinoraja longicauda]
MNWSYTAICSLAGAYRRNSPIQAFTSCRPADNLHDSASRKMQVNEQEAFSRRRIPRVDFNACETNAAVQVIINSASASDFSNGKLPAAPHSRAPGKTETTEQFKAAREANEMKYT